MDFPPPSASRKPRPKSDIYSTFVIHHSSSSSSENDQNHASNDDGADIYATTIYKPSKGGEEEEEDSSSLPPLLQRLPKDFGTAPDDYDDDADEPEAFSSGTFIVRRNRSSLPRRPGNPLLLDRNRPMSRGVPPDEDPYSTFVVKSTVKSRGSLGDGRGSIRDSGAGGTGTVIRRTGVHGFYPSFRGERRSEENWPTQQPPARKISVGSIPESVTREDPTVKYELLNELGELNLN